MCIIPSSPPEAMKGSFLFQLMTFTSLSWAQFAVSIQALLGEARVSQIRMLSNKLNTNIHNSSNISECTVPLILEHKVLAFKQLCSVSVCVFCVKGTLKTKQEKQNINLVTHRVIILSDNYQLPLVYCINVATSAD
jgi:hypothetical protein